jgi:putative ABC transport system ATP-binding protein
MDNILEILNLSRKINGKTIIDDFSYSFEKHRIYNILGPSGAGKSSLLRLINRLDEPSGGKVIFDGKEQCEFTPSELRRRIGYLFQTPFLFPKTVRDNFHYVAPELNNEDMEELLYQTQLDEGFLDSPIDNLSVGEQQRVALGRLLAMKPDILLLDEPTSALDPTNTDAIEKLIRQIAAQKQLTHNPEQALRIGGQAILLFKGKLVESGTAEEVVTHPGTDIGRQYRDKKLK